MQGAGEESTGEATSDEGQTSDGDDNQSEEGTANDDLQTGDSSLEDGSGDFEAAENGGETSEEANEASGTDDPEALQDTEGQAADAAGDETSNNAQGLAEDEHVTADSFVYKANDDGTCTVTGYKGSEANLNIPASMDGYSVTGIGAEAFNGVSLQSVSIPEGVSWIGQGAFTGCGLSKMGLTSWNIYDLVVNSEAGFNYGDHLIYYVSPRNQDGYIFGPGEDTGFGIAAKNPDDVRKAWCYITVGGVTIKAELVRGDDGRWHLVVDVSWGEGGDCNVGGFVYQDASGNETEIVTSGFFSSFALTYSDNGDGTCTVTGALGRKADLVIPETIGGLKVTAIADSSFQGASWLESVSLPEGLASIGDSAFKGSEVYRYFGHPMER